MIACVNLIQINGIVDIHPHVMLTLHVPLKTLSFRFKFNQCAIVGNINFVTLSDSESDVLSNLWLSIPQMKQTDFISFSALN